MTWKRYVNQAAKKYKICGQPEECITPEHFWCSCPGLSVKRMKFLKTNSINCLEEQKSIDGECKINFILNSAVIDRPQPTNHSSPLVGVAGLKSIKGWCGYLKFNLMMCGIRYGLL
uniref:Uncharacterized protein n=1 Tax=Megaselia scalaris TaxID=36166 RepID=T1GZS3_MEGSC